MTEPLLYVVVLTWNQKDVTVECLESMLALDYCDMRFVVVDNGSTDGTSDVLRERFPHVEVIDSPTNLGIAGGYNLGLEYALESGAEYVLVANNDIIVDPMMLRHLAQTLENTPGAGMAMPKIYHYYGDRTRLWYSGARWRRFPPSIKMTGANARDSRRFSYVREIEYAPSCCLLIGREALQTVGYFDTGYLFYYDDWDFSARMRKAGYSILFVPEAKIWHKVSMSTQKGDKPAQWWYVMGRSTVRFYLHHSTTGALLVYSVWFAIRESIKLKLSRVPPFLAGVGHQTAVERGWTMDEASAR